MKYLVLVVLCYVGQSYALEEKLTLEKFIKLVKTNNQAYKAVELKSKALEQLKAEAEILYSTRAKASINFTKDERPTTSAAFQGNKTQLKTSSLGIEKNTSYGSKLSLSYNMAGTEIFGAAPNLVPQSKFNENYASIEFSQSLIRNAFGSEIKSREKLILSNSKSNHLLQQYKNKSYLLEAENIFFQYQIALESIQIQKDSLKRAIDIKNYVYKKYKKRLSEKTDFLQAKAMAKQRELDLKIAKSELRQLKFLVYGFMGEDTEKIFSVDKISSKELKNDSSANIDVNRLDTASLKEKIELQTAQSQLNIESLKPDLQLKMSASFYGRDREFNQAVDNSFSTDNPVYMIGLSFSMPLDLSETKKAKAAYQQEINVAKYEYDRKVFEDKNNFSDLNLKIQESFLQLQTLEQLVEIQKEKYENENKILKNGRSTTFQVLSFEQEYLSTQLRLIQLKSTIANLTTQRKLYL